jgi:hypothetical protein
MGDNDGSETSHDPDLQKFVAGDDHVEPGSSLSFRVSTIDKDAAAKVDKRSPPKLNPIIGFMEKVKRGRRWLFPLNHTQSNKAMLRGQTLPNELDISWRLERQR